MFSCFSDDTLPCNVSRWSQIPRSRNDLDLEHQAALRDAPSYGHIHYRRPLIFTRMHIRTHTHASRYGQWPLILPSTCVHNDTYTWIELTLARTNRNTEPRLHKDTQPTQRTVSCLWHYWRSALQVYTHLHVNCRRKLAASPKSAGKHGDFEGITEDSPFRSGSRKVKFSVATHEAGITSISSCIVPS